MKRLATPTAAVALSSVLSACAGAPSALDPRGEGSAVISRLWWLLLWIATAVFLVVLGFLLVAVMRGRRKDVNASKEVRWGEPFIVVSGVVVPAIILIFVFVVSLRDMASLSRSGEGARLTVDVISHDWWWEARYPNGASTANEIHIPAGEPVRLRLTSPDVIHSFWVPQLQAKRDHEPGRVNYMWLEADEPGRYRGQCAEFCGVGHAKMAFYVVADPPATFRAWLANEARPARAPTARAAQGRRIFLTTTCAGCHAIKGTPADARVGPDLTHLAQRETLMAGSIANTRANLAQVITDPLSIKPTLMPPTELTTNQLEALLDYLEQLR